MDEATPNYFTCTLGQAAKRKEDGVETGEPFATILDVIERRAKDKPDDLALGFADYTAGSSGRNAITFRELYNLSTKASNFLSKVIKPPSEQEESSNVGLLCTSSIAFVVTWLGLVRLGYSVLLLAPQLETQAIEHLCKSLQIEEVLVDKTYTPKAEALGNNVQVHQIPSYDEKTSPVETEHELSRVSDVVLYFHTSGTSSGLPKPIPQTHHGLVGALPRFPNDHLPATFSTTPLYHGGLPDCFRCWTSGASIWFFPEGVVPITGANLTLALSFARRKSPSLVKYFSSVPYVLQMLAQEDQGLEILKEMDLVGVGGAALPNQVGGELVKAGVNLLSRLGSAECGFLMSSHRDYSKDKEWQYLRSVNDTTLLEFEPRENGLSELIVKPGWPFKVKTKREDGSYATADLFEPHPSKANAWRYHSRADSQITLVNGKKFDPSPMEESIRASSKLLQDVLIFGSGQDYVGVLLFPNLSALSEQDMVDSVWLHIESMNRQSQSHARITKAMLVVVPHEGQTPLAKSSKGTILRRQAEERYADIIEFAYKRDTPYDHVSDERLGSSVLDCFSRVLGRDVNPDEDLYRQGVDSIACIQIRKLIESTCLPPNQRNLPLNVIYDQGTVSSLVAYLHHVRNGGNLNGVENTQTRTELMWKLVEKYSHFEHSSEAPPKKRGNVVVLTGSTGFLGTHILDLLRDDAQVDKVYCLLRAQTEVEAYERVSEALRKRGRRDLGHGVDQKSKVICLGCDLSDSNLGLAAEQRRHLLNEATLFIHSAWAVNFNLQLGSFEDQIAGTRNLIDTATQCGARFIFISSTAAVSSSALTKIPEKPSEDPLDASPLGYSQSKWVTERVCVVANEALAKTKSLTSQNHPVSIIRVGQLCGNDAGIWNTSEAYPLMLSTAKFTRCLPDLPGEVLNWLPVDLAAKAILEIAYSNQHWLAGDTEGEVKIPVYHVLNPHSSPKWETMLQWISEHVGEGRIQRVTSSEWIARLEEALREKDPTHPSQALLGMWKANFDKENKETTEKHVEFDVKVTQEASSTMLGVKPLDRDRVLGMWKWICENVGQNSIHDVNGY